MPVVGVQWLWESVGDGVKKAFDQYLLPVPGAGRRPPAKSLEDSSGHATRPSSHMPRAGQESAKKSGGGKPGVQARGEDRTSMPSPRRLDACNGAGDSFPAIETHADRLEPQSRLDQPASVDDGLEQGPARQVPSPPAEDITATIAALLARKKSTAHEAQPVAVAEVEASTRRKAPARLLGRATSNGSARSTSFSRASSVESAAANSTGQGHARELFDGQGPEPSQKITYDDPDVQDQRDRVLRKMGGKVEARPSRTRSIGVARDAGSIGTRTRQKSHR